MTFLNPLLLLGLLAAAIPIVLHLLNLQRLKTVEFSTLKFLKELQKTKIRRLKIRQLLLLILRTLLIICLVLAFARPTMTGVFLSDVGARAKTSALILLDDSFSMTAADESGEFFQSAKEAALAVVGLLHEGDEAWVLPLSQIQSGVQAKFPPQRNFAAVRAFIEDMRPSAIYRSLPEALRVASTVLSSSLNLNQEVYVISDFQQGVWNPVRQQGGQERLFPEGTRVFLIPVRSESLHNLGIEEISIANSILEVNKPFTLKARIRNSSDRDVTNSLSSVFLNGNRVAQKGISIPANSTIDVEFSIVPQSPGFLQGVVELEADDAEYDNRRFFSLFLPEQTRVLLLGSGNDLHYIRLALEARGATSALQINESTLDRLAPNMLVNANVVVLANIVSISASQSVLLASFVKNGGGIVVFPGSSVQPAQYNSTIAAGLQLPPLRSIERLGNATDLGAPAEFEAVDVRHPLFQGVFEEDLSKKGLRSPSRSIPAPTIRMIANFSPTPTATPIVRLSNGLPFLLEHSLGSGKAILFAVSADLVWSDFPLQGLFVPLVHRAVSYLAQEQSKQDEVLAGQEALVSLTGNVGPTMLKIRTPDNVEVPAFRSTFGSTTIIRYTDTTVPGTYFIMDGMRPLKSLVVNIDPAETNTAPIEMKEIAQMLERLGIRSSSLYALSDAKEIQRVVLQSRFGVELWQYFLIAALMVAVAEMLVARDRKDEVPTRLPQGATS